MRALQHISARLIVVGEGPLQNSLKNLAVELGVGERVAWLGSVPTSELRNLYHAADLFVFPSTENAEAFGMVQLEAHASGLPVVGSDLPTGVTFVNIHGETGWTVKPGDDQALAKAVQDLLANPELRKRFGIQAQIRAREEFDTTVVARRYHALYNTILMKTSVQRHL